MNSEELEIKIKLAEEIAEKTQPVYRESAFKIILNYLLNESSISTNSQKMKMETVSRPTKTTSKSLPEMIKISKSKTHIDRVLITTYFMLNNRQIDKFNVNQVKNELATARQVLPGNVSDVVNNLIGKGFLAESEDKIDGLKSFYITSSGEEEAEKMINSTEN